MNPLPVVVETSTLPNKRVKLNTGRRVKTLLETAGTHPSDPLVQLQSSAERSCTVYVILSQEPWNVQYVRTCCRWRRQLSRFKKVSNVVCSAGWKYFFFSHSVLFFSLHLLAFFEIHSPSSRLHFPPKCHFVSVCSFHVSFVSYIDSPLSSRPLLSSLNFCHVIFL